MLNIKPRLSPTNTDKFYNLQYGWKTTLKEEVEYRNNESTPYCQTKYCYDNPVSMYPTRTIHIGSDGVECTEVLKRAMDMSNNVDSVFTKMKEINLISPIVKSLSIIDGKLVNEIVYRYQADKDLKLGFIAPVEELNYIPDTPKIYIHVPIDTLLFIHEESNYMKEAFCKYAIQKTSRMCVETDKITGQKGYAYNNYGKLLLESDFMGIVAIDKYKEIMDFDNKGEIERALKNLKRVQQDFPSIIETIENEVSDAQFLNFIYSKEHYLVASFANKIFENNQNLGLVRFCYRELVRYDYKVFQKFKQEYERFMRLYPKFKSLEKFVYLVEVLIHFSEQELFELYLLQYEVEKPSYGFDHLLKLSPKPDTHNLRLYILDGAKTASGSITHSGGKTRFTIENISPSKLKVYDIDLTKYTDISSITIDTQGSYMALIPEGANFKATSYNADGTVYARFDQTGNVEYYIYDAAGRVIQVKDQYGNIIKTYEYNQFINQ